MAAIQSNPFATRFTRPGVIDFIFFRGESVASLVKGLRKSDWWGQITGPHGSGKSTLVAAVVPVLEAAGRRVVRITVPQDQSHLSRPFPWQPDGNENSVTQVIIEGYERLSWWSRWRVKSACRRRRAGLLVTSHGDAGFPTLYRTEPTLELAKAVVGRLLAPGDVTITEADIAAAFASHPDNLREMLFSLYDLYQTRSAATGNQ
jgi:hypothetical protein